jgi:hypothetical protein
MARLTFDEIVTQGGLIGQNDAVSTWIGIKLKAWLRKHYMAWPWPFLIKQATGVSLTAGLNTKDVGAGNGGITPQIGRIFSPIYWRGATYSQRGKAGVVTFVDGPVDFQQELQDTSVQRGCPQRVNVQDKVSSTGLLYKTLNVYPAADQTYTLSFSYQELPTDPSSGDVPTYPNEMTLIQAAKCAALEYDQTQDAVYQNELRILAEMVAADRSAYGANPSFGDVMQLDSNVFLPGTSGVNWWGWR